MSLSKTEKHTKTDTQTQRETDKHTQTYRERERESDLEKPNLLLVQRAIPRLDSKNTDSNLGAEGTFQ